MDKKIKNSICPIIEELERIYDILAGKYGLDKIASRPIITIQTKGRKKNTVGWYWNDKWQVRKKNISEINICAENLSNNPVETLIHEMVHYHNASLNISDCNAHQYHNRKFKERAERYGLNVYLRGRQGWSATALSDSLKKTIDKIKVNRKIFNLYRKMNISNPTITKMIKYTCGCTIVRCATSLNAKCKSCGNDFIQEE